MKDILKTFLEDEVLGQRLGRELGYGEDLLESGLIDSLGVMRLVGFIQQELGIDVPPEDVTLETFGTIADISSYLEARKGDG